MTALLVAEPEETTRGFLERHLAADGFEVLAAEEGAAALTLTEELRPDLLLVDAVLPDGCGLELCQRLRDGEPGRSWDRRVPVVVLGPDDWDEFDRVRAFARGADDYVGKPFHYDELVARIRAILRRVVPSADDRIDVDGIRIDRPARRVTLAGKRIPLAGKEFELLCKLAADPERVFTKEELLREVWGFRSLGRTRTLDSHASRLRRKLSRDGRDYVINEWGVGYRLVGD